MSGAPAIVDTARRLRGTMSLPEVMLWQELRQRPGGLKFRRQHAIGEYVLDFYCASARLAVEIDGRSHDAGDRPERDAARDAWLAERGVRCVRIIAATVLADPAGVAAWLGTLIFPGTGRGTAALLGRGGGAAERTRSSSPLYRPSTIARAMVPLPEGGEDQGVCSASGEDPVVRALEGQSACR